MNEKQLKIFAGVFVFLLVVYFISKPRQSSVNLDDFVQNIVIGVGEDDVKSIEVYKETAAEEPARMAFVKAEDRWRIPTHYNAIVQKSKMDKLIRDLLEMTGNVRSSDPKHFDSYQISDIQGIHLLLKDEGGNTLANLIIGKRAEDYNAGFVRFADKEKVYSVDKNILSPLGVYGEVDTLTQFNVSFFIDLQAVNQDREKLETIGLVANGKEIIIQKKDKEEEYVTADSSKAKRIVTVWNWVKKNGQEVQLDNKTVDNFFRDVAKIRTEEVVDKLGNNLTDINKSGQYGLSRPTHYIVFKSPDTAQENVLFGRQYDKDQGFYMLVQYDGLVYKVSKTTYENIFKWVDELPQKAAE